MCKARFTVVILACSILVSGCAAMFVPATSDPHGKLHWAAELFDKQGRPLPAERLIREAVDIFQQRNDEFGLAEAYRTYGFFFRSAGVEKWQRFYEKNGFMDKTATYATRMDKSAEYFNKAIEGFSRLGRHDALTNVWLNLGFTHELMRKQDDACHAFERSLWSHREHARRNPGGNVVLPSGYNAYEEYVAAAKQRAHCLI